MGGPISLLILYAQKSKTPCGTLIAPDMDCTTPDKPTLCTQTNQPIHVPLVNGDSSMAHVGPTLLFPNSTPQKAMTNF
jgi:hypothetical protein